MNLPKRTTESVDHIKSGELVRKRRESTGKSLRWLAFKLKTSPAFLSDLERGRRNWTEARFKEAMGVLENCS